MDSKTYMASALRTESIQPSLNMNTTGTLRLLGVLTSAASVADTFKRGMFYGKGLNAKKLESELLELAFQAVAAMNLVHRLDWREGSVVSAGQPNMRLLHASIGMFGESGEMLEAIIKQINTGELDMANFAEELGDTDWYKAIAHDETGISEERSRATNIDKLKLRYPAKYSDESAAVRDLDAERLVLEAGVVSAP